MAREGGVPPPTLSIWASIGLQTGDEHQQQDADVGDAFQRLVHLHQPEHRWPQDQAGQQLAQHRGHADAAAGHSRKAGGHEDQDARQEHLERLHLTRSLELTNPPVAEGQALEAACRA